MTKSESALKEKTVSFINPKKEQSNNKKEVWSKEDIKKFFETPFNDLIFNAHQVHRSHFDPNMVQLSTLLSIKTGGCSEDCGY